MSCIFNLEWLQNNPWMFQHGHVKQYHSFICTDCNTWECIAAGGFPHPSSCSIWSEYSHGLIPHITGCPMATGTENGWCCMRSGFGGGDGCKCVEGWTQETCEESPFGGGIWISREDGTSNCGCPCLCDAFCDSLGEESSFDTLNQEEIQEKIQLPLDVAKIFTIEEARSMMLVQGGQSCNCWFEYADLCMDDIPTDLCRENGGSCIGGTDMKQGTITEWGQTCSEFISTHGACLHFNSDGTCRCLTAGGGGGFGGCNCNDCLYLGDGTSCLDVPMSDCPDPDREPCLGQSNTPSCIPECIQYFRPVVDKMIETCNEEHNQETLPSDGAGKEKENRELCLCLQNADITWCILQSGCYLRFDNEYGTNMTEAFMDSCLSNNVRECPLIIEKIYKPDGIPEITIGKDIQFDQLDVNTCCDDDCIGCILNGICNTESNCVCSKLGVPITNPDDPSSCFCGTCLNKPLTDTSWNTIVNCNEPGCNSETKPLKEWCWSCGPYQIKKEYWDDAQYHCGIDSNSPCCELANYNWEDMCLNQLDCETQKRISRLAIQCYWRKYTRNGSCQCAGECASEDCGVNTDCPDKCYTCEQLVRMHNGGGGWCKAGTSGKKRMNNYVKTTCEFLCENNTECASCMGCNCEDGGIVIQKEKNTFRMLDDKGDLDDTYEPSDIFQYKECIYNTDHMFNEEKERMKNRLRECVDSCISDCPPTSNPNEFCKVEWNDDGFPIEESGPRSFRNCVKKCKLEWNPAMQDAICKQCYDIEHCANLYNQPNDLCRCLWGGKCWRSENYPIPPQCDGDSEVTCCLGPPANPDSSFDPCAMLIPEHCYIFGGTPLQSGGCSDCPVHTEPLPLTFDTPTLDTPTLDTPTKTKTGGCCWGEVRPHGHQQHCRNWTLEQCNNVLGRFCGEGTECVTYDSGGIPPSCPCKPSDVPMNKSNPRKRSNKERQKFWEEYNNRK